MRTVLTILLASIALAPALARAEGTATFEVTVVEASKQEGQIDPRVADLKGKFGESAYRSLQMLSRQSVEVKEGQTRATPLPDSRSLELTFKERESSGRAVVVLAIPGVIKQAKYALAPGHSTEVGGGSLPHGSGVLFVSVKLVK